MYGASAAPGRRLGFVGMFYTLGQSHTTRIHHTIHILGIPDTLFSFCFLHFLTCHDPESVDPLFPLLCIHLYSDHYDAIVVA